MGINVFTDARPNIFLTAFFRSGSSHVKATLLRLLPNYHSSTTVVSAGPIGNDGYCQINLFAAQLMFVHPEQIFHQHTPGTSGNVSILKSYGVRPIVQMRNILDSMLSVKELLDRGSNESLGVYYPDDWMKMKEEEKLWWVVHNLPCWYFTFYQSWMSSGLPIHIVWYDEYYRDQVKGVRQILEHTGISQLGDVSDEAIAMAAEVIDPLSRFKFGRPGRGRQVFTRDMIDIVEQQAMSWGDRGKMYIKELIER